MSGIGAGIGIGLTSCSDITEPELQGEALSDIAGDPLSDITGDPLYAIAA